MLTKLKTAALSAMIGLGAIAAVPATAQAEGLYLNYGTGHRSGVGIGVQVGDYDPRDGLLDEVWGMLAEAAVPVVVHCGSGPLPGRHTGPGPFGAVLAAHPTLTAVIAHCGAPEYTEHLDFVARYPNVHVDTTMVRLHTPETVELDRGPALR